MADSARLRGRLDQFKPVRRSDQQTRRRKRLEEQKKRRRRLFDLARGIVDEGAEARAVEAATPQQEPETTQQQPEEKLQHPSHDMAVDREERQPQPQQHKHKHKQPSKAREQFEQQIMMAEEMESVPDDIEQAWSMVVCPKGKRCLVVAARGVTKVYNRRGRPLFTINSLLPGGSRRPGCHRESCVVDCVYDFKQEAFFVLDIIAWQGMNILDSEFEFRTFWLASKWAELMGIEQRSEQNERAFVPLQRHPANAASLHAAVTGAGFDADGVVFYHNQGTYDPGLSPLALWVPRDRMSALLGVEPPAVGAKMATATDE